MRTPLVLASAALLALACKTDKSVVEAKPTGVPGEALATRSETITVTVQAVDVARRTITVQAKEGESQTVQVGPAVKRLAEISPGDVITLEVNEGLLLEYQPAGEAAVPPRTVVAGARAGTGAPPGGAMAAGLQGTVTIVQIDSRSRVVTFQDPDGNQYKVKAGEKVQLDKLKVGDRLLATYVATVAITAEKGGSKL